jgi:SAM-dependent methyltransferase
MSTKYHARELNLRTRRNDSDISLFHDLAREYDAWFDREERLNFSIELQAFRDLLPSLPKPWLEIGVSGGRSSQALGIETGIDLSLGLTQKARRRGINTFVSPGEQEPFDEESLGTVFLIATLCFLNSPVEVLKEANRILIPSGKLILGFLLKESPWGQFYEVKKAQRHRFYRYATFYRGHEVVRLLVQAGFVIEKIMSTLFQKPGEVQHVEEPKLGYFPDAGFMVIVAGKRMTSTKDVKKDYC